MTPNDGRVRNASRAVCFVLAGYVFLIAFALQSTAQIRIPISKGSKTESKSKGSKTESKVALADALAAKLDAHGLIFDESYDTSQISITGFCKARRQLVTEYAARSGARATLTVEVFGEKLFSRPLNGTVIGEGKIGQIRSDAFQLPDLLGPELKACEIIIHAQIQSSGGTIATPIELYGIGLDVPANPLQSMSERPRIAPASYLAGGELVESLMFAQSRLIGKITVSPDLISTNQKQKTDYSFKASSPFGAWAAEFRSISSKIKDGRETYTTKLVKRYEPDEPLRANNQVHGEWDGLNSKGQPSRGKHNLIILGWWSRANGGAAFARTADSTITVQ